MMVLGGGAVSYERGTPSKQTAGAALLVGMFLYRIAVGSLAQPSFFFFFNILKPRVE